jgi:hypothetical protein
MVLKIKGKDIKFGFGLYFLGKAQKENSTDLRGLLESLSKNPIADMVDLMYYSAKCEAELDEVKLDLTKREFLEHLEETKDFQNTDGLISQWSKGLMETIRGNFLPESKEEEGEVKKK